MAFLTVVALASKPEAPLPRGSIDVHMVRIRTSVRAPPIMLPLIFVVPNLSQIPTPSCKEDNSHAKLKMAAKGR